jgi:phosphate transport system protein
MTGAKDHIVKSFDDDIERLDTALIQMGGLAEAQLSDAITAFAKRDGELAERVVAGDARIDAKYAEIETQVVRLLALRQPVAGDLRRVVAALRVSGDLERIGDYAANVAKRTLALTQMPAVRPASGIPRMGRLVQHIIKDVLDAWSDNDADRAYLAWSRDEEVDELYNSLFRELLTYMMEDPRNISACTHILFMAKNIERMGDHATNIAEALYFVVNGTPLREVRAKADQTSYAVYEPADLPTSRPS